MEKGGGKFSNVYLFTHIHVHTFVHVHVCDHFRLKKLEDLANEIPSSASTTTNQKIFCTLYIVAATEYERSCTSLPQREGEEMACLIKEKLYVRTYYIHVCIHVHIRGTLSVWKSWLAAKDL